MALIEVKRTSTFKSNPDGLNWLVKTWYHNTETGADETPVTFPEESDAGNFNPPTTELLGTYCRETTRVDVYPSAAEDGTTRLEEFPNATECAARPPGEEPGGTDDPTIAEGLENDPYAPAGAILLSRRCKSTPDGTFSYSDRYYVPSTRTVVTLVSKPEVYAATCTNYLVPADTILDRYCLEAGVAPFTERRVRRNPDTTAAEPLVYEDVDNVEACQLPACQLRVTAVATQEEDGLFTVVLTPELATGDVVFSVEYGQAPPQAENTFTALPAGRITFVATETREGGCTAKVTLTLRRTYGVRYRVAHKDSYGRVGQLLYLKAGYTGPVIDLTGAPDLLYLDWPGGGMDHVYSTLRRGSEAEVNLLLLEAEQMLDTFSGSERLFRVDYVRDSVLQWRGFHLPEQYSIDHLCPPNGFNTRATDGLGALDGLLFEGAAGQRMTGQWSLLQVVQHCLSRLDLDLPLRVLMELYPQGGTATQCALEQAFVDVEAAYHDSKGEPWSCGKVLDALLETFGLRIAQQAGALWLERISDLTLGPRRYFAYDADGNPTGTVTAGRLRTVTHPDEEADPLYYRYANQRQSAHGAVARVDVKAEPGELVNLLERVAFVDPEKVDATGWPQGWAGTAPVTILPSGKRDTSATLLITGAAPGASAQAVEFLQTPATLAVPADADRPIRLSYKATLRSTEQVPDNLGALQKPTLFVGIRHGDVWLGLANGTTPQYRGVQFDKLDQTIEVDLIGVRREGDQTVAPLQVRFLQVVAPQGHARYDVEISDLKLTWAVADHEEDFQDNTVFESESQVSREDKDLQVYHTDTPNARYGGTLLNAGGYPTTKWYEPSLPGQLAECLSYLVADRFLAQYTPAQILTGTLRGDLRPLDILTDPQEGSRQAYYVFPSLRYHAIKVEWEFTAVQSHLLGLPAGVPLPGGTVETEESDPVLSEDNAYVLPEVADGDPTSEGPVIVRQGRKISAFARVLALRGSDLLAGVRPTEADPSKRNIIPTLDQIKAYVLQGFTGGATDTFTAPLTFSLSNGKTFGKYTNGQTAPWTGLTAVEAIQDAGVESIYPTYTIPSVGISQSQPADGELGESLQNTITGSFYQGDAGGVTGLRLYRNGVQLPNGSSSTSPLSITVQMVRSLTPTGLYAVADYAAGAAKNVPPANTPDDRTPQVRNPNAPLLGEVGLQSGVIYYTGYYGVFFGPGPASLGRNLSGKATTNQGRKFTLETGTTETVLSILIPPGFTLTSVTDLDNQNLNLTSKYVAGPPVSVPDAGGTSRPGYTPYQLTIATPYTRNARHEFTYAQS